MNLSEMREGMLAFRQAADREARDFKDSQHALDRLKFLFRGYCSPLNLPELIDVFLA